MLGRLLWTKSTKAVFYGHRIQRSGSNVVSGSMFGKDDHWKIRSITIHYWVSIQAVTFCVHTATPHVLVSRRRKFRNRSQYATVFLRPSCPDCRKRRVISFIHGALHVIYSFYHCLAISKTEACMREVVYEPVERMKSRHCPF